MTLGDDMEASLTDYLKSLRVAGGIVNSGIVVAAATGIVEVKSPEILEKNGGSVKLTQDWAKKFLARLGWSKRKGTTSKGQTPADFPELKERMLSQLEKAVTDHKVPPELVVNWDQTAVHYIPCGEWTMAETGSQNVNITGLDDKREITAVLAGSVSGRFLAPQLIFDGKTERCHPHLPEGVAWPDGWDITHNPKHWSNEETMIQYFVNVLKPYKDSVVAELGLPEGQHMVALFDVFRGQWTEKCKTWLKDHHIIPVQVPPNCTDKLQPMDIGINRPIKDKMKGEFIAWYSEKVKAQLDRGVDANAVKVSLLISIIKPQAAQWFMNAFDCVGADTVKMSFRKAGITERIFPNLLPEPAAAAAE